MLLWLRVMDSASFPPFPLGKDASPDQSAKTLAKALRSVLETC